MTILSYSIAREHLSGTIGDEKFELRAYSGGGRGRVGLGAEHKLGSFDYLRKEKGKDSDPNHIHGGPIPPGFYVCKYVKQHPKFHECIFLEQTVTALLDVNINGGVSFINRDRFYIHGSGIHGSDGCIVVVEKTERARLNKAIKGAKNAVLLRVSEPGKMLPASLEKKLAPNQQVT